MRSALEARLGKTREMIARFIKPFEVEDKSDIGFSGHAAEPRGQDGPTALSA